MPLVSSFMTSSQSLTAPSTLLFISLKVLVRFDLAQTEAVFGGVEIIGISGSLQMIRFQSHVLSYEEMWSRVYRRFIFE